MDEIANIARQQVVPSKKQDTSKNQKSDESFDDIFTEKIQKKKSENLTNTQNVNSLGEVPAVFPKKFEDPTDVIIAKSNTALDMLENYANALNSPNNTLKDIEPLLIQLNSYIDKLMDEFTDDLDEKPKLKEIIEETQLTANLEYLKFQRGDYITSSFEL